MIEKFSEDKKQLFALMKKEAFFKERIVLSSGKISDYYLDARRVTLSSQGAFLSARVIWEMIKDETFAALGGPTLGADPMLGAINVLCYQNQRPIKTFIIRKAPKAHGKQQQVEGPIIPEGSQVILIDDVATTGKAFLESIDVLRRSNIKVKKAICLVDRQEGAKEALAQQGCPLVAVFTAQEFLKTS
jgi:orotate phosphoribosyltransferase